ncbi:MAG: peptidylprolyl isomerase, partial [Planctomycetota bacterium]
MSTSEKNIMAMREAIETMNIDTGSDGWKTSLPMFPEVEIDADAEIFWVLETNHGNLKIRLMPDVAPNHVRNVMYLTELGFYDDLTFHRVITGFMAQGGCPEGTGMGGPGYRFAG